MPLVRVGIRVRRSRAFSEASFLTTECNIYRVAIFRFPWPFLGHEIAGPRSAEHSGSKTQPRPQPGRPCPSGGCQPGLHGQDRERKVRGIARPARTHCGGTERGPGGAFREAVRSKPFWQGAVGTSLPETAEFSKRQRTNGETVVWRPSTALPVTLSPAVLPHSPNPEGKT